MITFVLAIFFGIILFIIMPGIVIPVILLLLSLYLTNNSNSKSVSIKATLYMGILTGFLQLIPQIVIEERFAFNKTVGILIGCTISFVYLYFRLRAYKVKNVFLISIMIAIFGFLFYFLNFNISILKFIAG